MEERIGDSGLQFGQLVASEVTVARQRGGDEEVISGVSVWPTAVSTHSCVFLAVEGH